MDKEIELTIKENEMLYELFPLMAWKAWDHFLENRAIRTINTHLAVKLVNKAQSKINQKTQSKILDKVILNKEDGQTKIDQEKSLGGLKKQKSPSTNASPNGNNPSNKFQSQGKLKGKKPAKQATMPLEKLSGKQRKLVAKAEKEQRQKPPPQKNTKEEEELKTMQPLKEPKKEGAF